jgi:folate-dependent phosphoribosylglycinamide formyltransferase PurN
MIGTRKDIHLTTLDRTSIVKSLEHGIVMVAGPGRSTRIIYNALKSCFNIKAVIIERPVSRYRFLRRRIKKLGYGVVIGQILFRSIVVPYLNVTSLKRAKEIMVHYGLSDAEIPECVIRRVASINTEEATAILREFNPNVVIVNGTAIISNSVLNSVSAKFINMHAGITPMYRGVHGAYWAIVQSDYEACGVTVHLVDSGIDTGAVLEQTVIPLERADNFTTYPLLQIAVGLPLLKGAVQAAIENCLELKPGAKGVSRIWSHPTIGEYLQWRLRGVK